MNRAQAHRHPDLAGDCVVDEDAWADPPLTWPNVIVIAVGVAAILVAVALVGLAFIALAGSGQ